jgi:hypothetical protein
MIETPPAVRSVVEMKGVPLRFNGPIRLRIADELAGPDARDLFDRLKKVIDDERERFHGTREPYLWGRP